jgi:hypothetical protein
MKKFSGIAENADTFILEQNLLKIALPACIRKVILNF